MSSTTGPSNKSGDGRRRSTRKRQTPHRYGFHDVVDNNNNNNNSSHNDETGSRATKRRKLYAFNNNNNNMESLLLTMIPHDLLLHHILSFCSSVQDRKALQSTNRLFRHATNSPLMIRATQIIIPPTMTLTRHPTHPRRWISKATVRKCFPIVGPAVGREKYDTDNDDDNSSDDEEIHVPFDRYWNDYFHHWETSLTVTRTLLPFLRQGNRDALLLLALLAVYVEDDLETGLTLLHYSATTNQQHQHHHHPLKIGGDVRAKHELGMLLSRHPKTHEKDVGRLFLQQAAQEGHAMSQLITVDRKDITMTLKRQAQAELMLLYSTGLKHLLRRKADPPHPRWGSYKCYNPYCHRQHYRATPRCRSWLHTKPFSNEWQPVREQVLQCVATLVSTTATHSTNGSSGSATTNTTNTTTTLTSIPSPYFDAQDFYYVPRMPTCGGCRTAIYCDAACQRLHWRLHKTFCRAHAPPNHNNINNNNDNNHNHNNNNHNHNDDNDVEVI